LTVGETQDELNSVDNEISSRLDHAFFNFLLGQGLRQSETAGSSQAFAFVDLASVGKLRRKPSECDRFGAGT
jgi:hypothetical protein